MAKVKKQKEEAGLIKDDVYKNLEKFAASKGKTIREVIMDDKSPDFDVAFNMLYDALPKLQKMITSREKFRLGFLITREHFLSRAGL